LHSLASRFQCSPGYEFDTGFRLQLDALNCLTPAGVGFNLGVEIGRLVERILAG
jgi:hypothetical protein